MKEAKYYTISGEGIICTLCPHNCFIKPGKRGSCGVRINIDQVLYAETYGKVSALHFDPIEKKPLYHYFPGRTIFSVGNVGCNLHCKFCQNSEISQSFVDEDRQFMRKCSPEEIVIMATSEKDNMGIAYTYNEPAVWYEYMADIATLAHKSGLKNIMVTNGYINKEPLKRLFELIDAFSVDLKAFTDEFYRKITSSKLDPVKQTLMDISRSGKHLEITNLVIPTLNDNVIVFEEMVKWIANELGKDTVLHISRYHPSYKMAIEHTPQTTLLRLFHMAQKYLDYVFVGNINLEKGNDTFCSKCGNKTIQRIGFRATIIGLNDDGHCKECGNKIINNF